MKESRELEVQYSEFSILLSTLLAAFWCGGLFSRASRQRNKCHNNLVSRGYFEARFCNAKFRNLILEHNFSAGDDLTSKTGIYGHDQSNNT